MGGTRGAAIGSRRSGNGTAWQLDQKAEVVIGGAAARSQAMPAASMAAAREMAVAGKTMRTSSLNQIGQKLGFSQFMWLYQQKRQHKQHLREMRSYVSEDVQIHRENVKKFEKYFFNPDAKAKAAAFEKQQLLRENKAMLKRLFKVSIAETPISAANNPRARLGVARKRSERLKALREARSKLNYINSENRLLLKGQA